MALESFRKWSLPVPADSFQVQVITGTGMSGLRASRSTASGNDACGRCVCCDEEGGRGASLKYKKLQLPHPGPPSGRNEVVRLHILEDDTRGRVKGAAADLRPLPLG